MKKKFNLTGTLRTVLKSRPALPQLEKSSSSESLVSPEEKTKELWDAGFSDIVFSNDIISTVNKVKITQDGAVIFDVERGTKVTVEILIEFLMSLITAIETDPYVINDLRVLAEKVISPNSQSLLHEMLGDFLKGVPPSSNLMNALKCLSSEIMEPALNDVRNSINKKYPILQDENEESILIKITESEIEVTSLKKEMSDSQLPELSFYVKWQTTVSVDLKIGVKSLKLKVTVTEVEFDENVKSKTKREIREILDPFIDEVAAYRLIWTRNLSRLPVHKDLSRLSKSIVVVDASNRVIYQDEEQKLPGRYSIHELLRIIATKLNDKPVLEALESFPEYVKAKGDLSEQVFKFFQTPGFQSNGPVCKVLKCINQEMIYPAVQTIRDMLYQKYPYKDVKGGWHIKIILDPRKVCIQHVKKEQSHDSSGEGQFSFSWSLKLTMDPKLKNIYPSLSILDFDWGPQVSDEMRAEIMDLTFSLIDRNALYLHISRKPLSLMPITDDLIEIANGGGFEIISLETAQNLYEPSKFNEFSPYFEVVHFISSMSSLFDGKKTKEELQKIGKKIQENSSNSSNYSDLLNIFLSATDLSENSVTMKILKNCRNEMTHPGLRKMKKAFGQDLPLSKQKESWKLFVAVGEKSVIISHIRKERGRDSEGTFEFKWSTTLNYNKNMTKLNSSEVKVIDFNWDSKISEKTKQKLKTILSPFCGMSDIKQEFGKDVEIMSTTELIKAVCNALDRQPDVLFPPHLTENLRTLSETLQKINCPVIVTKE